MADEIITPKRDDMQTRDGVPFSFRTQKFLEALTEAVNTNSEESGDAFDEELVEQELLALTGLKLEPRIKQNAGRITNMAKELSTVNNELAALRAQVNRQKGMIQDLEHTLESIQDSDMWISIRAQLIRMQEQTHNAEENSGYGITRLHA